MNLECTGAGIIIFFDNRGIKQPIVKGLEKDILYLFLSDLNSNHDFPKGSIDFGEFPLDCAIRETFEEVNLSKSDYFIIEKVGKNFVSKKKKPEDKDHVLRIFIAEIKKDSLSVPKININPHTKIKEHKDFYFLRREDGEEKLLEYLKEPMKWCDNIVLNFLD